MFPFYFRKIIRYYRVTMCLSNLKKTIDIKIPACNPTPSCINNPS